MIITTTEPGKATAGNIMCSKERKPLREWSHRAAAAVSATITTPLSTVTLQATPRVRTTATIKSTAKPNRQQLKIGFCLNINKTTKFRAGMSYFRVHGALYMLIRQAEERVERSKEVMNI
ncbi:hypothetical protein PoB_000078200 [Plakobranchus ocellatus]|uniref:Uncharacterized protein n=1 Tax=Plakobranchus ocellatus TaxID=259542 RepID=A0AAV3XVX2_9GAST|nr:hypothetical protein PoB_000078200 [Plakobranchus ocellatus]